MIILLPHLIPSELLCYSERAPYVNELLQCSCAHRQEGLLTDAEHCALRALSGSREAGDHISQGAALICLADVHREMGKLGPALDNCQRAQHIFQRQPSRYQRHNEAVAIYALGLVHHLLGNDEKALKWYRTAGKQFEKAQKEWAAVNALRQVEDCDSILSWLEILIKNLIAGQSGSDAVLSTRIQVPIIRSNGDRGRFAIVEMEIDRYRVGRHLRINGDSFRLQSVKGRRRVTLEPGTECYALEIPDEACESLEAGEGDYALVIRGKDADKEGPGVLETLSGTEFGDFKRDEEGNINFVTFKAAMFLGSDEIMDDFEVGYIAALLKRESKDS
jgi:tetratricopeptide (TPR) repeat protein